MNTKNVDSYLFKILYNESLASAFELNEYDEIIYKLIEDNYIELNHGMKLYDIIHKDLLFNKFISCKQLKSTSGKYNYILNYMDIGGKHNWTAYILDRKLFEKSFLKPYIQSSLEKNKIEYNANRTHIENMVKHTEILCKEIKKMEEDLKLL